MSIIKHLNQVELSRRWSLSPRTLERWRWLGQAYLDLPNPALFTALNRDTWELHCELVPFDARVAQTMSDKAVQVVQASEAEELLPRAAGDPSAAVCRGGRTGGDWHAPCPWQDKCWETIR